MTANGALKNDCEMFKELNIAVADAAKRLVGCYLERTIDGECARVKIVETEAYDQTDAASHSYKGRTARTDVMFGRSGRLYVYFTYGMHYCCNIVVGEEGYGAAVLIRAVQPIDGETLLKSNRPGKPEVELTNGPAKLCQALRIDRSLNGHDLHEPPIRLIMKAPLSKNKIITTTRVGISKEIHVPWRFYEKNNPYVSRIQQ